MTKSILDQLDEAEKAATIALGVSGLGESEQEKVSCFCCQKPVWKMITLIKQSESQMPEYWCQDCWDKLKVARRMASMYD